MFLRFYRRKNQSKVEEYAQIAEKYRENGRQITKIIRHLGPSKGRRRQEEIQGDIPG